MALFTFSFGILLGVLTVAFNSFVNIQVWVYTTVACVIGTMLIWLPQCLFESVMGGPLTLRTAVLVGYLIVFIISVSVQASSNKVGTDAHYFVAIVVAFMLSLWIAYDEGKMEQRMGIKEVMKGLMSFWGDMIICCMCCCCYLFICDTSLEEEEEPASAYPEDYEAGGMGGGL